MSDRQCMEVELSMQYCGEIFRIYLRHIKRLNDAEFERKVDVQSHRFLKRDHPNGGF